eukprot:TRINITY_DN6173_c0_g1_i1.p2 TRINITY_DN6173_c0_g1~~TRINITY_DN6173_c0_g1_i1.p2  ORF type:complete len:253 (-),score=22.35 TRINITY_DN6173_c0_g1_i1:2122-2880(-)
MLLVFMAALSAFAVEVAAQPPDDACPFADYFPFTNPISSTTVSFNALPLMCTGESVSDAARTTIFIALRNFCCADSFNLSCAHRCGPNGDLPCTGRPMEERFAALQSLVADRTCYTTPPAACPVEGMGNCHHKDTEVFPTFGSLGLPFCSSDNDCLASQRCHRYDSVAAPAADCNCWSPMSGYSDVGPRYCGCLQCWRWLVNATRCTTVSFNAAVTAEHRHAIELGLCSPASPVLLALGVFFAFAVVLLLLF